MRMTRDERERRFMNLAAGVGSLDNMFSFIRDLMQDLNAIEVANGDSAIRSSAQSDLPQNALTSGDGSESAGLRSALEAFYTDNHRWSTRPCETCAAITAASGVSFGCDKMAGRLPALAPASSIPARGRDEHGDRNIKLEAYHRGVWDAVEILLSYKLPPLAEKNTNVKTMNEYLSEIAKDISAHSESAQAYAENEWPSVTHLRVDESANAVAKGDGRDPAKDSPDTVNGDSETRSTPRPGLPQKAAPAISRPPTQGEQVSIQAHNLALDTIDRLQNERDELQQRLASLPPSRADLGGDRTEELCGTAPTATTSTNEATRPIAKDAWPTEEALSQPHRIVTVKNSEELEKVLNEPEPNVKVMPDGSCQPVPIAEGQQSGKLVEKTSRDTEGESARQPRRTKVDG